MAATAPSPELYRPPRGLSVDALADYTRRWADRLMASVQYRLRPTEVQTSRYVARAWEMVLCDPVEGSFTVVLPAATPDTAGHQIGVDSLGDNTVLVQSASGSTVCHATELRVAKAAIFTSTGRGDWVASEVATGWTDLTGSAAAATVGVSSPTFEEVGTTGWISAHFRHDQADDLHYVFQAQHSWDEITAMRAHVHFIPLANGSGDIYWSFRAVPLPVGATFNPTGALTNHYNIYSVTAADQYVHKLAGLSPYIAVPAIPAGNTGSGTMILGFLQRIGTNPSDTYTTNKTLAGTAQANVLYLSMDLHYWAMRYGTRAEY